MELKLETTRMHAHVEAGIGWMIFDHPERLNALSRDMQEAIPEILAAFNADPEVRVVVMKGAGERAFVSGADIGEMSRPPAPTNGAAPRPRRDGLDAFADLEKPLIAMIRGYALGAGLLTALKADLRIAASDARFGIPAVRLGLGYGFESSKAIVDAVGRTNAAEILLTGRQFNAEEALSMGLVNHVVPVEALEPTVRELAATIAQNAPLTLRLVRESIRQTAFDPAERDMDRLREMVEACTKSEDFAEGRRAFAEKRTPNFVGR
jgi:enoyl-CoA hydratase